jgi:Hemerythrin HHE cation binding domain
VDAIAILRTMHSDTKFQLKNILGVGVTDAALAQQLWVDLQHMLDLHEQLEDEFVYAPLAEEMGPGTPLGDWLARHDGEVAIVKQLIASVEAEEGGTPEWRMAVSRVADALQKHVTDEEGQIFGRIQQAWDSDRLESAGAAIDRARQQQLSRPNAATRAPSSRASRTATSQKPAATAGRRK